MTRRVLITGSRDWADHHAVEFALRNELEGHGEILILNGMCPSGADFHAHRWYLNHSSKWVAEKEFPADWGRDCTGSCYHKPRFKNGQRYCPIAGHLRNQAMVDFGADVCLAFPLKDSRGTYDCMKRAKKADIPVRNLGFGGERCLPGLNYHSDPHRGCILR
ncbi:DprA-like DNA processing chain A [Mycobacterium phage MrMagoo]|uniref:DprA-like DNA processing chain A n=1 Tax=Mycobacterium phage MrMagoo TaxID=1927020 RepID=A0A1L6BYQ0_9CAUD|nr:DprA-like DNA processing chain A [Mycobacterium phage MrMagoo]APQ42224.1 DprA-like DNA processing chain A [Mycobacterium phage MrMagoo]ARM70319.1 DprA-like DNA processing chain A [Mycobacterium phage GardenSalsa]